MLQAEKGKKYDWFLIATKAELESNLFLAENNVKTIKTGNKKLCIVRTGNDYFAVDDKCPHAGASLGQGKCSKDGFIICPHHRYSFSLYTGRGHGYYVETYPMDMKVEGLFVGIKKKGFFSIFGF